MNSSTQPDSAPSPASLPRFGPPTTANPLWRIVVVSGAAFCVACLLWITAGYANPEAPGNQWLNRHGLQLIVVTGIATISSAVAAMVTDARQTRAMPEFDSQGTHQRHDSHPEEPQA